MSSNSNPPASDAAVLGGPSRGAPAARRPSTRRTRAMGRAAAEGASQRYSASRLLVITVFALLVRITLFMKGSGDTDYGYVDNSALIEVVLTGLTGVLLLREQAFGRVLSLSSHSAVGAVLLYYVLGAVSACWSEMPSYSLFRAIEVLIQFMAILVIMFGRRHFASAENTFLIACAIDIALEMLGQVRLNGGVSPDALHTTSYSQVGLMLFVYCSAEWFECKQVRSRKLIVFGLYGLGALVAGTSSGSNIATVIGLVAMSVILAVRGRMAPVLLALCVGGVLILAAGSRVRTEERVMSLLAPNKTREEVESFGYRKGLWENLMVLHKDRPWLGRGFIASTRTPDIDVHSAHNAFLQVLLDTGNVGLIVFVLGLLIMINDCCRSVLARVPGSAGFAAAFAGLLAINWSSNSLGNLWMKPTFAFAFLAGLYTFYVAPGAKHSPARSRKGGGATAPGSGGRVKATQKSRL